MRRNPAKLLLVEGLEESRVLPYLLEANGVPWPADKNSAPVYIDAYGGVENLLVEGEIEVRLKSSGLQALGVLVDADEDAEARWQAIRRCCRRSLPDLPEQIPEAGLVAVSDLGVRFGAWLMPDNRSRGMLETFLLHLRPDERDGGRLHRYSQEAIWMARATGAPWKNAHADKAQIHSWLAWQDPPGRQLHQAITERILRPDSPHAAPFVRWFRNLFDV